MTEIKEEKIQMMRNLDKMNFPEKTMKKLTQLKTLSRDLLTFLSVSTMQSR